MKLRVGTRRSPLALTQTRQTMEELARRSGGVEWEIVEIRTTGDRILDRALRDVGGKGLFVKELDEALLDGRVDCAVHSLKDVPSELPDGIEIAAILERAPAVDVLVTRDGTDLAQLPTGSRLGTTSPRRAAQALLLNASLDVQLLRGSVETRLGKVRDSTIDATFLARAGLNRLGIDAAPLNLRDMDPATFVPAVGQGAIAVTARSDDAVSLAHWALVEDPISRVVVVAERAFARVFGGGCHLPIAAYATVSSSVIALTGLVIAPDGARSVRRETQGPILNAEELGHELGCAVLAAGADSILASVAGVE
ncbi:MAG: hydroxymethylbilane synthase [Hyphomicrobiaceae bacterium]|jgi:hydroxymethylbilane synthase